MKTGAFFESKRWLSTSSLFSPLRGLSVNLPVVAFRCLLASPPASAALRLQFPVIFVEPIDLLLTFTRLHTYTVTNLIIAFILSIIAFLDCELRSLLRICLLALDFPSNNNIRR